jgi:hypothetical protein
MLAKLIFLWYVLVGQVEYQQTFEGTKQYALFFSDGKVVDFATEAEIKEYIMTGTFEYNEYLGE